MSRRFSPTHRSSVSTNESQRVRAMEARHRSNAIGSQHQQQGRVRINKPILSPSFEKKQQGSLLNAFRYAGQGFMSALAERNFRIHLAVGVVVALVNLFLDTPAVGWALTMLCVAGVLVLELLNTALETLVDLVTLEYHPLAKRTKDIVAAAVLVAAIASVVVGLLVWVPLIIPRMFS